MDNGPRCDEYFEASTADANAKPIVGGALPVRWSEAMNIIYRRPPQVSTWVRSMGPADGRGQA